MFNGIYRLPVTAFWERGIVPGLGFGKLGMIKTITKEQDKNDAVKRKISDIKLLA